MMHVSHYGKSNYFMVNKRCIKVLNRKGLQLQLHAPARVILKIHVWYVTRLKHWHVSPLAHDSFIFYTFKCTFLYCIH